MGHNQFFSKTFCRKSAAFSSDNRTDEEKLKESIRRAAESAKGRATRNPPRTVSQHPTSFFTTSDYNPGFRENIEKQNMIKSDKEFRFAIVGSGPAGFYMAKNLIKSVEKCRVDLIDRNPHPFGLIRTGVAPDHQAMKKIENDFSQVLKDERCQFLGNVFVHGDQGLYGEAQELVLERGHWTVSLEELREKYSAVILAYGAASDRELGLEGEKTLQGVLPSRRIVEYYNGSLDMDVTSEEFDPEIHRHIGIIGNGNIACDIARMFLKDPSEFHDSDTPEYVMEKLRRSKVNTVQMIGRRGITQAAFSTKEIRELASLSNLKTYMVYSEVEDSMTDASHTELLDRAIGRRTKFLRESFEMIESAEHYEDVMSRESEKKLILRFLRSPTSLIPATNGSNRIGGVGL